MGDWQDEGDPFWPVEFLGRDLEETEIISFGYRTNASKMTSDGPFEENRVFNHGEALCNDLMDKLQRTSLKVRENIRHEAHTLQERC